MTTEQKSKEYVLGFSMLYHPLIHGRSKTLIYSHFLYLFEIDDLRDYILSGDEKYNRRKIRKLCNSINHPIVEYKYSSIVKHKNNIYPDILQVVNITYKHKNSPIEYVISCAIKKTFWLRIIQRKWKSIMEQKKRIIQRRSSLNSLHYREMNGKWSNDCNKMPTLRGMLSEFKKKSDLY